MNRAQRRALPRRTYRLTLTGELEGFHVTMAAMRGREVIALTAGDMDEGQVIDLVAERMLEHDFGVDDPRDLDAWMLGEIVEPWVEAHKDAALPPVTGEPSQPPSDGSPSVPTRGSKSR